MPSPITVNDVQRLKGNLAALGRFISGSSDKCKDFFGILRKGEKFKWSEECEEAFQKIKLHLASLPVLQMPEHDEVVTLYLGATSYAISAVLIKNVGVEEKRLTSDSQLVIRRIGGQYTIHDPILQKHRDLAQFYIDQIPDIKFRHICRKDNRQLNALAYIASILTDPSIEGIRVMRLLMPSIPETIPEAINTKVYVVVTTADKYEDGDWRKPIHQYLETGELPKGRPEINKIKIKESAYELRDAAIVSDNGKQLQGKNIDLLFNNYNIRKSKATPIYPQSNGQAEITNNTITYHLKKKLDGKYGEWYEDLYIFLWDYRTTQRDATGLSPFMLRYGTEAIFPTDAMIPTTRTEALR
ncbi:uncharacterized protein LOC113352491 [Papaver somniferum]|uniref:uncharacterized protein LOC113352491 n=1 Tax=Papaver somniferum TaxID=3469 RepID=UPI000E6FFDF7|nr:uncharacterized protein LOC113352491 [Papaver somniferum]